MGDTVSVVPPLMLNGEIRVAILNLSQAMNSQDNIVTNYVQAMTTQVNREVVPHVPHYGSTTTSHFRDFNRIKPSTFYWSKEDEDPHDFLDEVYKILFFIGVTIGE